MQTEQTCTDTRLQRVFRILALIVLLCAAGLIIAGLLTFEMRQFVSDKASGEDMRFYRGVIESVRCGENYYEAVWREFQFRDVAPVSVLNWRLPFLAWLIAYLPHKNAGQILSVFVSLAAVFCWFSFTMKGWSRIQVAAGGVLISGLTIYATLPDIYTMHELWAGALILVSLFAYANGWMRLSWISGTLALFIRELALPFVLVMLLKALLERKWEQTAAWGMSTMTFVVVFVIHTLEVRPYLTGENILHFQHWLDLNGWAFVLATIHIHPLFFLLPSWVTSALTPLALLGFIAWRDPVGDRVGLTVAVYMVLFLFVGKHVNAYWGLLYVSLLPLGFLRTHEALTTLIMTALGSRDINTCI